MQFFLCHKLSLHAGRMARCYTMSACSVTELWGAVRIKYGNSPGCHCQILVSADLREVIRVLRAYFTWYLIVRYNIYSPIMAIHPRFSVNGSVETVAFICWGIGNFILLWRRWDVHLGLKWDTICNFFYFRVKRLQSHTRVIAFLPKVVTTSICFVPATSGSVSNISFIACCIFIFQSSLLNWVFNP